MPARMVAGLDAAPESVMAYCDLAIVDANGEAQWLAGRRAPERPPALDDMLRALWPIVPSGFVMRRRALEATGRWPEELTAFEDVYLWLRLREQGGFIYVPERLVASRAPSRRAEAARRPGAGGRGLPPDGSGAVRSGSNRPRERQRARAAKHSRLYRPARAAAGERARDRRAFACALRFDPLRMKNYL